MVTEKQAEKRLLLQIKSGRILDIFWAFFNKTIIPLGLVGYDMNYNQLGATCLVGFDHLISNKREWNNC